MITPISRSSVNPPSSEKSLALQTLQAQSTPYFTNRYLLSLSGRVNFLSLSSSFRSPWYKVTAEHQFSMKSVHCVMNREKLFDAKYTLDLDGFVRKDR
jgi:hypothetical protein